MTTTQKTKDDDRKEINPLLVDKPFDFIERTKPEDRLGDGTGQQTRDNVNPAIPSAPPGTGDVVRPESTSGGVAPPPAPKQQEATTVDVANLMPSINEPPGSNITTGEGGPAELPPLILSDISPDTAVIGSGTLALTVTGSGFTPATVVVFDDVDAPTTFVSPTELTADVPVSDVAEVVDVEVSRGDDLSDVLSFEFTAVQADEAKRERKIERKPKKAEPVSKRQKKGRR